MKGTAARTILGLFIPALFALSTPASLLAQDPCLGYAAIACAPSHQAIESNSYFQVAGRIKHKGTSTGAIQIFCPVFNTTGALETARWNSFSMLYKDPDDIGSASKVTAALRFVATSGRVESVATLDSNQHFPPRTSFREMSTPFSHTFNFLTRRYYVQITVDRNSADLAPEIAGFNICKTP